jgi:hypothetical protein
VSDFSEVIDAIRAKFIEVQAERGVSPSLCFEDPNKQWLVGRLELKQHKTPPYVGWVRGGGPISPPDSLNPLRNDSTWVSPLYAGKTTVMAVICGANEDETEALWHDVLRAVHRTLLTDARPGNHRWMTQEDDNSGLVLGDAELVMQEFEWPMTIASEVRLATTVTTATHDDDLLVSAEGDDDVDATHPS